MDRRFLTPQELCERWRGQIAVSTLAVWRSTGKGPAYTKVGRSVLYSIEAIEEYENSRIGETASEAGNE